MASERRVNLNADLGESFGAWSMGDDAALLPLVNSANLACGFHAGDPLVMRRTLQQAMAHGVSIGAHPSYPDLQGFGRRPMGLRGEELLAVLQYQLAALAGMARAAGGTMQHVKPHGALSNAACADMALACEVVQAVQDFDPRLILLAPALSALGQAARAAGLPLVEECFADRAYLDDGQLVPRAQPGAVLHEAEACWQHVARMLDAGGLVSHSGKVLPCQIGSICVHGDGPQAVATARLIRQRLLEQGYRLVALPALLAA